MITSFFKPKRDRSSTSKENDGVSAQRTTSSEPSKKQKLGPPEPTKKKMQKISPETAKLISHLKNTTTDDSSSCSSENGSSSWAEALDKHFSSPSFGRLASFVENERKNKTVFPPEADTFAALNLCPLSQTKVVIVGQDPYHGPRQAHGLCFSVRRGIPVPPSLRNIYKELHNDPSVANFTTIPTHGNLERWAKQGVLMINNVLTVRQSEAHSHKKKGWEAFTDDVIRAVDKHHPNGVVFLLWGKPATEKTKTALAAAKSGKHTILCSSHPSPLGATKTNAPFMGSRCFSKANEALKKLGHDEIDWRVDGELH